MPHVSGKFNSLIFIYVTINQPFELGHLSWLIYIYFSLLLTLRSGTRTRRLSQHRCVVKPLCLQDEGEGRHNSNNSFVLHLPSFALHLSPQVRAAHHQPKGLKSPLHPRSFSQLCYVSWCVLHFVSKEGGSHSATLPSWHTVKNMFSPTSNHKNLKK